MIKRYCEAIERYGTFYKSREPGLLVLVSYPMEGTPARVPPLNEVNWRDEKDVRAYARARVAGIKQQAGLAQDIGDDTIPCLQVLAGAGMAAAAHVDNAALHHETNTNYMEPPLTTWEEGLSKIGFKPDNPWYLAQMWILRTFIEEWDGTYGITPYTHFDPLDLVNQFRGNDLFYDISDHPQRLQKLLKRSVGSILELERHMRANYLQGYDVPGTIVANGWIPAGNYLSCDAGDMMSVEHLRQWGLPYTEQICTAWGGAFLHHHELGIHQILTWSRCQNLSLQFCNRDPNTAHLGATGVIDEAILESTFRVPLHFICTAEEFLQNTAVWRRGKFMLRVRCASLQEAKTVVQKARAISQGCACS